MSEKLDLNLYLKFKREDDPAQPGRVMQVATASFGGVVLTEAQRLAVKTLFGGLPSCNGVEFGQNDVATIDAVPFGQPNATRFIEQVTACGREHFTLRRVLQK